MSNNNNNNNNNNKSNSKSNTHPAADTRVLFAYSFCIGHIVKIHTADQLVYEGVLHAISYHLHHLILKSPCLLSSSPKSALEPLPPTLLIHLSNIAHILVSNVNSLDHQRAKKGFQTDTAISGSSSQFFERKLEKWQDDESDIPIQHLGDPDSLKNWDQFKTNEAKFGISTDYKDELYTTKLDRLKPGFAAREREAARIAKQIERSNSLNPHVLEERNSLPQTDVLDEEERYGAVTRTGHKQQLEFPQSNSSSEFVMNKLNSQLANVRPTNSPTSNQTEFRQRTTSHSSSSTNKFGLQSDQRAARPQNASASHNAVPPLSKTSSFVPGPIPPYRDKSAVSLAKMKSAAAEYLQTIKSVDSPVKKQAKETSASTEPSMSELKKLVSAMPVLHPFDTKHAQHPWPNQFLHHHGNSRLMSPSMYMAAVSSSNVYRNSTLVRPGPIPSTNFVKRQSQAPDLKSKVQQVKLNMPSKVLASRTSSSRPTAGPLQSPTGASIEQLAKVMADEKRNNKRAIIEELRIASKSMSFIEKNLPPKPKDLADMLNPDLAKQRLASSEATHQSKSSAKRAKSPTKVISPTSQVHPMSPTSGSGGGDNNKELKKKFSFNLSAASFVPTSGPSSANPSSASRDPVEIRKVSMGFFAGKELQLSGFSFKDATSVFNKMPPTHSSSPNSSESITWSFNSLNRSYKQDAHGDSVPIQQPYFFYQPLPPQQPQQGSPSNMASYPPHRGRFPPQHATPPTNGLAAPPAGFVAVPNPGFQMQQGQYLVSLPNGQQQVMSNNSSQSVNSATGGGGGGMFAIVPQYPTTSSQQGQQFGPPNAAAMYPMPGTNVYPMGMVPIPMHPMQGPNKATFQNSGSNANMHFYTPVQQFQPHTHQSSPMQAQGNGQAPTGGPAPNSASMSND